MKNIRRPDRAVFGPSSGGIVSESRDPPRSALTEADGKVIAAAVREGMKPEPRPGRAVAVFALGLVALLGLSVWSGILHDHRPGVALTMFAPSLSGLSYVAIRSDDSNDATGEWAMSSTLIKGLIFSSTVPGSLSITLPVEEGACETSTCELETPVELAFSKPVLLTGSAASVESAEWRFDAAGETQSRTLTGLVTRGLAPPDLCISRQQQSTVVIVSDSGTALPLEAFESSECEGVPFTVGTALPTGTQQSSVAFVGLQQAHIEAKGRIVDARRIGTVLPIPNATRVLDPPRHLVLEGSAARPLSLDLVLAPAEQSLTVGSWVSSVETEEGPLLRSLWEIWWWVEPVFLGLLGALVLTPATLGLQKLAVFLFDWQRKGRSA
jgi:hypothetical protein